MDKYSTLIFKKFKKNFLQFIFYTSIAILRHKAEVIDIY
jgi:hypothetical protein